MTQMNKTNQKDEQIVKPTLVTDQERNCRVFCLLTTKGLMCVTKEHIVRDALVHLRGASRAGQETNHKPPYSTPLPFCYPSENNTL